MKTIILLKEEKLNEMIDVYGEKAASGAIFNYISKDLLWLAELVGIMKTNGDAFVVKSKITEPETTIIYFKASDIEKLSDEPTEAVAIEVF